MKQSINEMTLNGVTYVPKDSVSEKMAQSTDGLPYVIVRQAQSGCHAGYLKKEDGNNLTLVNSRRLYYWDGAATLSQLAMEGVSAKENCKFPCEVAEITIYGCCEKSLATEQARKSISEVKVWKR